MCDQTANVTEERWKIISKTVLKYNFIISLQWDAFENVCNIAAISC